MRTYWGINGGENIEIYDGTDAKDKKVIYRIGVERIFKGEIKIIKPGGKQKIINNESRMKIVDVVTSESLFIEFVGRDGSAFGWYEFVSAL